MSNIPSRRNGEIIYAEHINTLRDAINELEFSLATITSDYVITDLDFNTLLASANANDIAVTLPDAVEAENKRVIVKCIDFTFDVKVLCFGDQLIDNKEEAIFYEVNESKSFVSDGSNWYEI